METHYNTKSTNLVDYLCESAESINNIRVLTTPAGHRLAHPALLDFHLALKAILSLIFSTPVSKVAKSMKGQYCELQKGIYYQNFNFLNISQKISPSTLNCKYFPKAECFFPFTFKNLRPGQTFAVLSNKGNIYVLHSLDRL